MTTTAKTASPRRTRAAAKPKPEEHVPDLEAILPTNQPLMVGGIECEVRHLKTREFFKLMGIVTSTLGPEANELFGKIGKTEDSDEMAASILGVLMATLPHAVDPMIRLLTDIVVPVDGEQEFELAEAMDNPEIEELFAIVDGVITNEKDTLFELMGKARAYLAKWKTTVNDARGRKRST